MSAQDSGGEVRQLRPHAFARHPLLSGQVLDQNRLPALMPPEFAAMLAGMDSAVAEGAEDRVTDTVQRLASRPARTFRTLVEREPRCGSRCSRAVRSS